MRHQLERGEDGRYHCTICLWSWAGRASSIKTYCPGVPHYAGYERMPDHLKTFTMLRKAGLKTEAQPAGCIYIQSRKEWVWLYDERQATPRRKASATQRCTRQRQGHPAIECHLPGMRPRRPGQRGAATDSPRSPLRVLLAGRHLATRPQHRYSTGKNAARAGGGRARH